MEYTRPELKSSLYRDKRMPTSVVPYSCAALRWDGRLYVYIVIPTSRIELLHSDMRRIRGNQHDVMLLRSREWKMIR